MFLELAAALVQVTGFGDNPGALDMFEHTPSQLAAGRPVVVVLHGCSQTAAVMQHAGWDELADQLGFDVVYPQQRITNDPLSCFHWFTPAATLAEARSVVEMVDFALAAHGGDRTRIFVTGASAGGAFAASLLALDPDWFAAEP